MMANVSTPEIQKIWSNLTASLRLGNENTMQQNPGADTVMEGLRGVLTTIACIAECTPYVSQQKSETDCNCSKYGGHQEESPPASGRKAAV
jgi:hypothetical protein